MNLFVNRDANTISTETWLNGGNQKQRKRTWKRLSALLINMETTHSPNWISMLVFKKELKKTTHLS